jgi:hypothetical protein
MKRIIFIFLLILVSLGFSSCSDFLDIEPREDISIKEQFSTVQRALQALNGAYKQTENVLSGIGFIYPDLQGGNFSFAPRQTGNSINTILPAPNTERSYNFNENAIESPYNSTYEDWYDVITNVNNIITFTPQIAQITQAQENQILAEAFALRAFAHYNLLQLFAQTRFLTASGTHLGIVYADRILTGGVDFESRKTVQESYILIQADLDTALSLFTNNQAMQGPSYSYFTEISTTALYARVALQSGNYAEAITNANKVINESGIIVMSTATYLSEWAKPNLPVSEVILEFSAPVDSDEGLISSSVSEYFNAFLDPSETARYVASLDLLALFEPQDIRLNNFVSFDYDFNSTTGLQNRTFYFSNKFQDNSGTLSIRISEMYLILAESHARLNQSDLSLMNLNIIRNRANLVSLTSSDGLLDAIFLERRREMCFEGHLLYDIARFGKNVVRNVDCVATVCNLNFPNPKFVLPIPQSSVNINQFMIQNEGY